MVALLGALLAGGALLGKGLLAGGKGLLAAGKGGAGILTRQLGMKAGESAARQALLQGIPEQSQAASPLVRSVLAGQPQTTFLEKLSQVNPEVAAAHPALANTLLPFTSGGPAIPGAGLSPGASNLLTSSLPTLPDLSVARFIDPSTLPVAQAEGLHTLAGPGGIGSGGVNFGVTSPGQQAALSAIAPGGGPMPDPNTEFFMELKKKALSALGDLIQGRDKSGGSGSGGGSPSGGGGPVVPAGGASAIGPSSAPVPLTGAEGFGGAGTQLAPLLPQAPPDQTQQDRLAMARSLAERIIMGGGYGGIGGF